ncbi:hypothetical protein H0H87_011138 [Tephrocybe sp. NHM501043]|nr:hypothetical protein H0H87_011138 [Tephrocybe sp. NHM501043]
MESRANMQTWSTRPLLDWERELGTRPSSAPTASTTLSPLHAPLCRRRRGPPRLVDAWDVFLDEITQNGSVRAPEDSLRPHLRLKDATKGSLGIHPYRFVTGVLYRLLREYTSLCVSLSPPPPTNSPHLQINPPHVDPPWAHHHPARHSRNQRVDLPPPSRNAWQDMTAQPRPSNASADTDTDGTTWDATRSSSSPLTHGTNTTTSPNRHFPHAPLLPPPPTPRPRASSCLAGASPPPPTATPTCSTIDEIGNANDAGWNASTAAYLSTALGRYFPGFDAQAQAKEDTDPNEKQASVSAVKSL